MVDEYREKLRNTPIAEQGTRLIDRARQWNADLVALLGCALRKDAVLELLEGLSTSQRGSATSLANHVLTLDSATRKARLAREFGERLDGNVRLRELVLNSPGVEHDLWRRMPAHHQRSYPQFGTAQDVPAATTALRTALLDRLIKESLR